MTDWRRGAGPHRASRRAVVATTAPARPVTPVRAVPGLGAGLLVGLLFFDGSAAFVQGAVVAGVLLTLALVLWSAVRRQRA